MGKETRQDSDKGHATREDTHDVHANEAKSTNLDAQGREAIKKVLSEEGHGEAAHGEGHHDEHSVAEKLEHWAHEYAKAMHVPHLALEGLEKFAHIVGELGAHDVHVFLEGAGGKLCKGTLSALCIPMALAHSQEYAAKAQKAFSEGNSSAGTYYAMQAVLQAGGAIPEIGLAFTFVSEMLQVSESKGLVYEYVVKNLQGLDGNNLRAQADVVFQNHDVLTDMSQKMGGEAGPASSSVLSVLSSGHPSRDAAFAAVKKLREHDMLQDDYAVTQDGNGTFAVHRLVSNTPIAFDISDKRELESSALKHDNKFNIVALVAEDGTWGRVEHVDSDGVQRWDVIAAGKL